MHRDDMDGMTRRGFLKASGVLGVAALLSGANLVSMEDVAQAAVRTPLPLGEGILVVVTLYGGNDGLNTVIPYADPVYHASRPGLAYSADEVLPLDARLGLNPGMTGMKALWDAGRLAIVRGVEYPSPDHSHFRSMDIWQSASPDAPESSGWLGRWLDHRNAGALRALNIGATMPPLLVGRRLAASALPIGGLRVPAGPVGGALRALAGTPAASADGMAASQALSDWFATAAETGSVLGASHPSPAPGSGSLGQQLDVVARLIAAGVPTNVYSVSLGGFDTHAGEKATQTSLLAEVSAAVAGFVQTIDATPRAKDVTVMVYSEFGRRVAANLNQGTDHGTAGPLFLVGSRIGGGYFGEQPPLNALQQGDLAVTTDFRDVYATLLERVLATPADAVIPGWSGRLLPA